ncbi:glycosyltransferase family protein [Cellulomonas alba]|uniref:Polysaccharide pyruvyl transferase domain-containing protein n=1 Tax=Cellulomonas alba TaxID=3053467 RepID=A0ABT7SHD7_9CELL|nr:hypothetical protein [Cellulomonas alba]MDM7855454.1 hypothetical protein [Cellulomonas alba]
MAANGPRRVSNFGDEFSPLALSELTGSRVRWRSARRASVYGIGSLLETYQANGGQARVFGSGLRTGRVADAPLRAESFLAVRGVLTRSALGLPEDTPLGDPGVVVAELGLGDVRRGSAPVFLPHFGVLATREGARTVAALRANGYEVALPNTEPLEIARRLAGAPFVATTSLHGLVFANALGVPATLVSMPDVRGAEPRFKYDDYLSALGDTADRVELELVSDAGRALAFAETLEEAAARLRKESLRVAENLRAAARAL